MEIHINYDQKSTIKYLFLSKTATNEEFDLNFFPLKEATEDTQARFPLLSNPNNLGDLETTTTQVPLVTQSLSPMENREALTQLGTVLNKILIITFFWSQAI